MMRKFKDRTAAGRALARALRSFRPDPNLVVVALPRGGVPVGYEVARTLHAPLDVCVVRKLGVPGYPELAMGTIASGDVCVMNPDVLLHLKISRQAFDEIAETEGYELRRRELAYRDGQGPAGVAGRTVVLVDDGLATGATMRAAIASMRRRGAARVIVAVPVGAEATCRSLGDQADDVYCLLRPEPFGAIGEWYEDFPQLSDDDVRRCLRRAAAIPAAT
jgi:putative phosphoribosyl transferase